MESAYRVWESANMARDKSYNIRAYQSFGNSWSCITAFTVSIRLNDALYQTRQMEAKLPINTAFELTPHLIRRMRRLFKDNKKKKSHYNLVIYNIQTFTTLSQQNKTRYKRHATAVPNSIDWIKFDFSTAVARRLKPSRATFSSLPPPSPSKISSPLAP